MSKLYKTTYPSRLPDFDNFFDSATGSHDVTKQNQRKSSRITKKQTSEFDVPGKLQEKKISRNMQSKIEIDPSLLISPKKNSRNSTRQIQNLSKNTIYRIQPKTYQRKPSKQRPASKQQQRSKVNLDSNINSQVHFPERPHTSKGVRPYKYMEEVQRRKISFQIKEDLPMSSTYIDRRAIVSSSQSRRTTLSSKYNFETSIDPQFLSLFAAK